MSDIQPNPKPAFLDWNYRADCKCERDFGLDRTIFLDLGGGLIRTPEEIAKQMIDMLPIEVWNRNTTFLDPCCKSGVFLKYISDRLLVCPDLIEAFPNPRERVQHIQLKQLHGIAWTNETYWQCRKQVNRSIRDDEPNSIRLVETLVSRMKEKDNGYYFEQILKENFGRMNFDVVIGNPPYNNDIYLDFVTKGHQVANKYSVWITPAKWQAKGGLKNEDFRKNIVPYMSKIVYYPDCTDVFVIQEADGISYYLIDKKEEHNIKELSSKCKLNENLSSGIEKRTIQYNICNTYNNIITKVKNSSFKQLLPEHFVENNYSVYSNDSIAIGGKAHKDMGGERYTYLLSNNGNLMCISKSEIVEKGQEPLVKNSVLTFSSTNKSECENFIKWTELRFTRFMFLCGLISRNSVGKDIAWRFVPDPGKFDHIFTDEELYKKYNLTQEEINIIESVIKERK